MASSHPSLKKIIMRILGIDPSVRSTGYALIEGEETAPKVLYYGKIKNPPKLSQPECLCQIYKTLKTVIEKHHPEEVGMEAIIYVQNTRTAIHMGAARGAAMVAIAEAGLPVTEYPAKTIKKAATGQGAAKKEQVGFMIRAMLGLTETPGPDEADALAIALTHLRHRNSSLLNKKNRCQ